MAKRSLNEKKTAINNIRSRVHLACDDALPDPCVMHILILNFRNSKDFNKIQRISSHILSWKEYAGEHDADVEYVDLFQSCWQEH